MTSPLVRLIIILWAVAVATTPAALAHADARVEAAALAATANHVEALGGTDCAPVHDADCGVCSSLRLFARTGASVAQDFSADTGAGVSSGWGGTHFATSDGWPERQPRAPPAA